MNQKLSAIIGMVGGLIDLMAGWALLQTVQSIMPIEMPQPEMTLMVRGQALWLAYFLLGLGVVVFITGIYVIVSRMMRHGSLIGWLMILYGVLMLFLGVGMIGQLFAVMQSSLLSGGVMIVVGISMLYSGYGMRRMK